MLKKIIAHVLLLPYNILCVLLASVIAIVGGAMRNYQARDLAETIANKRKSTGLFVFIQILVFVISLASAKLAGVIIGVFFVSISVLGKYLLSNGGASSYQPTSKSHNQLNSQSNSNSFQQQQNQYQQNQYQQNRNDEERRKQDAERDRQRREQQEYYERQQRESQQRHEEQMRRDEELRRRQREEEQRRNEENRKNWGRF